MHGDREGGREGGRESGREGVSEGVSERERERGEEGSGREREGGETVIKDLLFVVCCCFRLLLEEF